MNTTKIKERTTMLDFFVNFKLMNSSEIVSKKINDIVALSGKKVLVGVPEENDPREDGKGIGNAALAYIHDKGSPLASIPSRPFMNPGISRAQDKINDHMLLAAKAQLNDKPDQVEKQLIKVGTAGRDGIKEVINDGEGFAPLERATLLERTRKRKYLWKLTKEQRAILIDKGIGTKGIEARRLMKVNREEVMESMHPLIDTGALRNSITYVISDQPVPKVNIPTIQSDKKSQQTKGKAFEGMMLKENIEKGAQMARKVADELGSLLG